MTGKGANGGSGSSDYTKFIGSFVADGNGNITSGALTQYGLNDDLSGNCTDTLTGTYSIQSDATGTATLTLSPSGTNGCASVGAIPFAVQAAQQGDTLLVAESDGTGLLIGQAAKQ